MDVQVRAAGAATAKQVSGARLPRSACCLCDSRSANASIGRACRLPPGPPTAVTSRQVSQTSAVVAWVAPLYQVPPVRNYSVAVYSCSSGLRTGLHNTTAATITIHSLALGQQFKFAVAAVNGVAAGPPATSPCLTIPGAFFRVVDLGTCASHRHTSHCRSHTAGSPVQPPSTWQRGCGERWRGVRPGNGFNGPAA